MFQHIKDVQKNHTQNSQKHRIMSRRTQECRKSIFTLESMFLMSASGTEISPDANLEIDPGVGPLPELDFPAEWIIAVEYDDELELQNFVPQDHSDTHQESSNLGVSNDIHLSFLAEPEAHSGEVSELPLIKSGTFAIPDNSTTSLAFVSEGAGYQSTIGTYLIDESSGKISDVRIAFLNASRSGSGGELVRGDSVHVDVADGKRVGFFILADGNRQNDLEAFADHELTFRSTKAGGHTLIATDADGTSVALDGKLYTSNASMNPDELDHFKIEASDSGLLIQIEDLPNLGDGDFDDVVVELNIEKVNVVAPEFSSLNGSATFIEATGPVVLDANATLNDLSGNSLNDSTLTLQRNDGANSNDVFASAGSLNALTEGSDLVVNETSIGQVSTNSDGTLAITFNENATTDLVNSALRQITYSNSSDYISGDIDITWTFATGNEGGSAQGSTSVRLIDSDRIYVTTSEREVDGDTSSIAALIANNGGTGISLEEAIIAANNTENVDGADEIFFNIAGDGVHIIAGIGQPDITEAVTIDAASESDFTDSPLVVLDGNDAAGNAFTLTSTADGSEIRGFNIRDFAGNGIVIQAGSDDNVIANNWIGRLANDGSDAGVDEQIQGAGIVIQGAYNYIGGMAASEANVISGSYKQGIRISGDSADYNVVHGNMIGTDRDGTTDLGNRWAGIRVDSGADGTIIGGMDAGAGNILSGNDTFGVRITGEGTDDSVIQGNLIGTDQSGTLAIGNEINGIRVDHGAKWTTIGGSEDGAGNVVSGNRQQGVRVSNAGTDYTVIQGNVIGTDSNGSFALGNGYAGVRIDSGASDTVVGGNAEGAGNILSGNGAHGIRVNGGGTNDTTIQGNLIGIDESGTQAIGNNGVGVFVDGGAQGTTIGGSDELAGNVVSANGQQGIRIAGEGTDYTIIQGNVIGTNNDGTAALGNKYAGILIDGGAADSVVGGDSAEAANILSGNGTFGVRVTGENTDDTTIQGNLIGTNDSGTEAIGNANNGVRIDSGAAGTTVGGTSEGAGNVISGNGTQGVRITGEGTDFTVVLGNVIGTDSNGLFELGNRFAGVLIDAGARSSVIGGSRGGSANIVSGNGTYGVRITGQGTNDHTVQGNLIGTDHTASVAIGNASSGVRIDSGAQKNTVGGSSTKVANVIGGNGMDGIQIDGTKTDANVVQNNYIETQFTDPVLANAGQSELAAAATTDNIVDTNGESMESEIATKLVALADFLESQDFDPTEPAFNAEGIPAFGLVVQANDQEANFEVFDGAPEVSSPSDNSANAPNLPGTALHSDTLSGQDAPTLQPFNPAGIEFADDTNPMLIVQDANVATQQARTSNSSTSNRARTEAEDQPVEPNAQP